MKDLVTVLSIVSLIAVPANTLGQMTLLDAETCAQKSF